MLCCGLFDAYGLCNTAIGNKCTTWTWFRLLNPLFSENFTCICNKKSSTESIPMSDYRVTRVLKFLCIYLFYLLCMFWGEGVYDPWNTSIPPLESFRAQKPSSQMENKWYTVEQKANVTLTNTTKMLSQVCKAMHGWYYLHHTKWFTRRH